MQTTLKRVRRSAGFYRQVPRCWAAGVFVLGLSALCPGWAAPIRNVILCIGDGMGPEQVKAAHCYAGTNLVFETFPYQSRLTTASADGEVTDSAAAATALSTGCKVYNGVLALAYPGDGSELETLLEHFSKLDKSTGLVTTSYLTDATPAGFGAHETSRNNYAEIANDYFVQTRPNVLLGGGGYGMDPLAAEAAGYRVVTNAASLLELRGRPGDQPVAGLFGEGPLPYVYDGLGDLPSLPQMVDVALGRLVCDPDGFFLMVEGGRIDHACHGNDLERCVAEALAFDEAVRVVVAWVAGRSDTLVVVTADHETGGLTVLADNGRGFLPDVSWGTGYHTATPVPVYGVGVNASQVASLSDNTEFRGVACSAALMPATGFRIERESAGLIRTQWAVNRGDVCRVEYTPTLMPPAWQASGTVTSFGTRVVCETTNGAPCAQGFYRMITIQSGE